MRPLVGSAVITNPFARAGSYASWADHHGAAGHHTGVDFAFPWPLKTEGRLVRSVTGGEVVISGYNATMGEWVGVYNHDNDVLVTYWHLSARFVKVGDWVWPFQALGRVGNTGNSTAAHLHVQANRGRVFNYHGHLHPGWAFKMISRRQARRGWRAEQKRRRSTP